VAARGRVLHTGPKPLERVEDTAAWAGKSKVLDSRDAHEQIAAAIAAAHTAIHGQSHLRVLIRNTW
jgi:hypothetical protein